MVIGLENFFGPINNFGFVVLSDDCYKRKQFFWWILSLTRTVAGWGSRRLYVHIEMLFHGCRKIAEFVPCLITKFGKFGDNGHFGTVV